jgi:hypothetical protein
MEYSTQYKAANRLSNLDGLEAKIITHLIDSKTHYAEDIWRLLNYMDENALSQPALTRAQKQALVFTGNNGTPDATKNARVFLAPFIDDAWQEQGSSLYIYVSDVVPINNLEAEVIVNIETIVHSQTSLVKGNGDPLLNPNANPNDSDLEGNLVVALKNRATTLVKDVVAELNGIYLDGGSFLFLEPRKQLKGEVKGLLWNSKSFYGHRISFVTTISGVSGSPSVGY